jgi:hypothetical protein
MRSIETIALSVLLSLAAGSTAFADVQFSLRDGRVSIVAKDATLAEILTEWAKIGQTTIINADRLPHDRVTLELRNVGEQQALDVLLRAVSGYLAAPRAIPVASASQFDRIFVMPPSVAPRPTSAAVSVANVSAPPAYHAPPYQNATYETPADPQQSDVAEPQRADDSAKETNDANDDQPTFAAMAGAIAPPSPSVQKTFQSRRALETMDPREFKLPSGGAVAGPPARGARPAGGVAVPGMVVQPPIQPRPPGVPGQPPVVRQ